MTNILIRNAKPTDLPAILKVEIDAFPAGRQATIETFRNRLSLFPLGFLVLIFTNKIVGLATALLTKEINTIGDLDDLPDKKLHQPDGNSYYLRSMAIM